MTFAPRLGEFEHFVVGNLGSFFAFGTMRGSAV
jgi:hypothetical protein